jgi:protein SHQ1
VQYSEEETKMLDELSLKDLSQSNDDTMKQIHYQLVDILFCYCYNVRSTEGENTVESDWTISKLSATLTFLQVKFLHGTLCRL